MHTNRDNIRVLTVGVFDILHIGHLLLFKNAKSLGTHLIVAVQRSEVVHKFKPSAKLVYNTNERLFMVSSLSFVDEVIEYDSVDKIITKVDFDIFAKGPDQNHEGFQKAVEWCEQNGKKVITIPRTLGVSSSTLREYLKDK